jgi:hypothetical protein
MIASGWRDVRRLGGWLLTIAGILWGVYGGGQLLIGTILAIQGPDRSARAYVALTGAVIFAMGALAAWGGRRLRRSAAGRSANGGEG